MVSNDPLESLKLKVELPRNFLQKLLRNLTGGTVLKPIGEFIRRAYELGLPANDVENSLIDLEYNEAELAFDTVAEQMYEYNIKIDKQFYDLSLEICETLKIDNRKYSYLKELLN